jgi:hypothetical protein
LLVQQVQKLFPKPRLVAHDFDGQVLTSPQITLDLQLLYVFVQAIRVLGEI